MHLIRPTWLKHGGEKKDFEVYSCHVSPDGTRLATAAGDGHVRVWSTDAIYHAADASYAKPKQLASMSHHTGTIHTVRFSSNGRFLASGADDKIVCIYLHDTNTPAHASSFGSDEPAPVENWRIFRRLIGHDNDVQDLGWSYDSSILVSVGLDSKVVVWSGHTFEKLKTISSHQSHVKGLTFDPANKYFATASDDRTVKVFRFTSPGPNSTAHDQVNNFVLEKSIATPFTGSPLTTYFRRCSWSPDGNHIAAANAVNGPVSSVSIINRGNWDGDIHLIGHEGPVEVCAFSPRLFTKTPPSQNDAATQNNQANFVTVIACAGQDKALSVWITSMPRPLVITQDLAVKSISDLAWSPEGRNLFATSLDGSIISVMFSDGELGYPVNLNENEKALAKFGGGRKAIGMVEGPTGMMLEEKSKEGDIQGAEGRMSALMGDSNAVPAVNGDSIASSAAPATTNGIKETPTANGKKGGERDSPAPAAPGDSGKDQQAAKLQAMKKRVTITKDGKKRMAPLLVSTSNTGESSLPQAQLRASTIASNQIGSSGAPQTILDLSRPIDGLPKGGLAALLLGNKRKLAIIEGDENDQTEKKVANAGRDGALALVTNETDGLKPATVSRLTQLPTTPEFIRPAVVNPSLSVSQVRLAVPKLRAHIVQKQGESSSGAAGDGAAAGNDASSSNALTQADVIFEARNPTGMAPTGRYEDREPARLSLTRRGQPVWQDFLPKSVLLMTGGQRFWAAACEDGSLYVWSQAGIRLLNALVLESQPVLLESRDAWLLCITAVGMCYVWDVQSLSSPHPPVSLAPILDIATQTLGSHTTRAPAVTAAHLNSEGRIIISLTNGDGYTYSPALYAWQRLSEVWWAVGSQYWNTADSSVGDVKRGGGNARRAGQGEPSATDVSAGVLPFLEKRTTDEMITRGRAYALQRLVKQLLPREGYESFESSVSIAHLENRLAGALTLGAKQEFQVYLYMYARRLGAEGLRTKVEELLRTLLGGLYEGDDEGDGAAGAGSRARDQSADRYWTTHADSICGWPRRELLKGVILILGKHRDLQRVTVPYAKLLGITETQVAAGAEDAMVS